MSVRALEERVYVRRDGSWDAYATTSDLILVEDRPQLEVGIVLSAGPKARDISEGDKVLFDRYAGEDHEDEYVFLKPSEVLALIV